MDYIFLINFIPTLILTGLIWTIQLVHYPSFEYIAKEKFSKHMSLHMKRISFIVVPLMLIEFLAATYLITINIDIYSSINLLCVALIWFSTYVLSIPCHNRLLKGYDQKTINTLVTSNWPRTILWSIKSIIVILIHFI